MSEQDMNEALDALETEHGIDLDQEIDNAPEFVEEEVEDIVEDEPIAANPPGYIDNLDDWIAAGKHPDDFKGKNAYKAEYERIQELRELKDSMKSVAEGVNEWKQQQQAQTQQQIEQAIRNTRAELEQAKDNVDIDLALEKQQELTELERAQAAPPRQEKSQAIVEFMNNNPIVNSASKDFDRDFFDDMAIAQQSELNKLTGGDQSLQMQLSDAQIAKTMNAAYRIAKDLNPDKFVSKRNSRQAAPTQVKRSSAKQGDYASKLKSANIKSKHNARDNSAANDIYEMLKASDPKAAETFAKNVLGE